MTKTKANTRHHTNSAGSKSARGKVVMCVFFIFITILRRGKNAGLLTTPFETLMDM